MERCCFMRAGMPNIRLADRIPSSRPGTSSMNSDHPFLLAIGAIRDDYPEVDLAIVRPPFGNAVDDFGIHRIGLPSHLRGAGLGTRLLGEIVEAADRHGVTLHVEPALTRAGVLDLRVAEWYGRAGFVWNDPDHPLADGQMHRRPAPSSTPAPS